MFSLIAEELLNNFSQTRECWRHSLYFLANTENQYVMMYCMTVLEVGDLVTAESPSVYDNSRGR